MSDEQTSDVTTQHALLRMAQVLLGMTHDMSCVTKLVSDLSADLGTELSATQMAQLQSLDRLGQSLRDLSIISHALADGTLHANKQVPHLQLAETRAILNPTEKPDGLAAEGSIELF